MTDTILTERRDRVLIITMNRPEAKNAINGDLADGLWAAIEELNTDPGITAAVLTGAGGAFCSGMDLKAFARGENISSISTFFQNGAEKPLVGAIEGFALAGGLEIALTCDLLVAAEGARLGIPEVKVGLFAAGAGLIRLPSRVGYGKAMEMAVTGDPISAEDGHAYGLISRLAPPGTAVDVAVELAERIARNAPLAVAASKKVIRATQGATEEELFEFQGSMYASVFMSNDAKEGPAAFAEKRSPNWSGT
jgi:enoyl-CoA hydratase/carnithine racemase